MHNHHVILQSYTDIRASSQSCSTRTHTRARNTYQAECEAQIWPNSHQSFSLSLSFSLFDGSKTEQHFSTDIRLNFTLISSFVCPSPALSAGIRGKARVKQKPVISFSTNHFSIEPNIFHHRRWRASILSHYGLARFGVVGQKCRPLPLCMRIVSTKWISRIFKQICPALSASRLGHQCFE